MNQIASLLIFLTLISCNFKTKELPVFIDISNDIVSPKHYVITKTNEQFNIDGKANELSWQSALFTDRFIDIEGIKIPKFDTKVKMLWDNIYLYVYAEMQEPHIWGDLKQRDAVIYYNNDFEIFINPSGSTHNYGEIEINALGTVWDLSLDKPYSVGGKANTTWNLNNLKSAIQIHGTLNDPTDIDSLWTVELAIPLKSLIELKNRPCNLPEEGEQWRINFSRVEWDYYIINGKYRRKKEKGKFLNEYNWVWSSQKVINMHQPEKWGILQFTDQSTSENVPFIVDEDMPVKQAAYALFRKIRSGSLNKILQRKIYFTQNIKLKYSDEETVIAEYHKTNFGFEIKIKNSKTNNTFVINEEGVLKTI